MGMGASAAALAVELAVGGGVAGSALMVTGGVETGGCAMLACGATVVSTDVGPIEGGG